MGVSILVGPYAGRMAEALESIADNQESHISQATSAAQQASAAAAAVDARVTTLITERVAPLETEVEGLTATSIGAVSYSGVQNLTANEKMQARQNMGLGDIDALTSGNVKYTEQTLSTAEQAQARANIGLSDIDALTSGNVKYNGAQNLTDQEQLQARTNIGLGNINDLVSGTVKYEEQTLTDAQKTQARGNIGAASSADLTSLASRVSDAEADIDGLGNVVSDVTKTETGLRINYVDSSFKDITIDDGGISFDGGYVDEDNLLHITLDGVDIDGFTPFVLPATGGGVTAGTVTIDRITDASIDCIYRDSVPVEFTFTATDSSGDVVGSGTGTWSIGGITVARNISVPQGDNTFDIGPYLNPGRNAVKLSVSVDTGGGSNQTATKTWTIYAANVYFEWPYDSAQINTSAFVDRWTPYGDISKTMHAILGETALDDVVVTRTGAPQSTSIPMQAHGAYTMRRWITTEINGLTHSTPVQQREMIFVEDGNMTPIVAASFPVSQMDQYDTITIPIVVYDPGSLTTNVELAVDGVTVGVWEDIDRTTHNWNYTPVTSGTQVLTVTCGETVRTHTLTVNHVDMSEEEVSGYSYRFKASELATNTAVRNWTSNDVTATFSSNFDWINGGLHTETGENGSLQQYLCIKAGTTMTINHKLFATDPKANGMNFKMIFKVKNCRDYDTQIAHCYSDVGLRLYAHEAQFNSSGTTVSILYGEDEYIELEYDVYAAPKQADDGNFRYIMAWIDGVIASCRTYGATDNFVQPLSSQENLVIGSNDCDIYLYMVKAYPMMITRDEHISNFIMDAPNANEMVNRYNRNNILEESGYISYEKLMQQNPDCRVWLYDIPYLTNAKDDKVSGCQFNQFWPNGDTYYTITGEGTMSIQGTSSVDYIRGTANTDINFTSLVDGAGNNLMANSTKDSTYGNNWFIEDEENSGHAKQYTVEEALEDADVDTINDLGAEWVVIERDSSRVPTKFIKAVGIKINDDSCPITYSNTKVNFASCEQVNNMCNAAWYQRFNPYPSLTARDCMEFSMGVQFIKDGNELPDDKHFTLWGDDKYHMYSIANMGNSKKNVHVFHDLSNPNECCIEVNNNTNALCLMNTTEGFDDVDWTGKIEGRDHSFGMRYPDVKTPSETMRLAWKRFVTWMAESNPNAYTGEELDTPEVYGAYTFTGHQRDGLQVLKGTTVSQYAGTYTHDTFNRRMAKMLSECEDYMVMDSVVYHFVYLERHTMVDNVAKNSFWSSTDLVHWDLSKAYDMDTSDGNNNDGQMVFDYGNEYNDEIGAKKVFNASTAVWFQFIANLFEACQTMFINRETAGAWSSTAYHNFLLQEQRKIPERCWVECYWYDYLRPNEQNITESWMAFLDGGQKTHQRRHFETFEEAYDSSKYRGSACTSQNITIRGYTPNSWGCQVNNESGAVLRSQASESSTALTTIPDQTVITVSAMNDDWCSATYNDQTGYVQKSLLAGIFPRNELSVKMYNKMYIVLSLDGNIKTIKAAKGQLYTLNFSEFGVLNDTVMNIYTAQMVQEISGIAQLYPGFCNFSNGVRLRTLAIGSDEAGYSNPNLNEAVVLGNNTMLERLEVQNLPMVSSVLDLSNCAALSYLNATGSGFTGYEFADGGLLATAIINRPVTLSMRNLAYLDDNNLTISDYTALTTLRFENVPGVNSLSIVNAASVLQIARILGVTWSLSSDSVLDRLYDLQGLDENSYTINRSVITGTAHVPITTQRRLDAYNEAWPNLTVTNDMIMEEYPVYFMNADGTTIKDLNGNDYVQYVEMGSEAYDPIEAGEVLTPTIASTAQYNYIFNSWSNLSGTVLASKTVTATYSSTIRTYTVRWLAREGDVRKTLSDVVYGSEVTYNDDPTAFPSLDDQESRFFYRVFKGWNKSTGFITEDTDVYAIWDEAQLPAVGVVDLKDMSVAQISAVAKNDLASDYWNAKDYVDITAGKDFTFENVESEVLAENLYFNGTASSAQRTTIALFDENAPSFTLAIDYEFIDTTSNATLVSCFDSNGNEGFRLKYLNGGATIEWGNETVRVGTGLARGIVVIRHVKGQRNLYIASDNTGNYVYNDSIYTYELPRATETETSSVLTFGAVPVGASGYQNVAKGHVYWCKIWYADLGNTVIGQLAGWPHETWRLQYIGPYSDSQSGQYFLADGSGSLCAASFIFATPLQLLHRLNATQTGDGYYPASEIRTFLNSRVYNALPYSWQILTKLVQVKSATASTGGSVTSNNRVYLPSAVEVYANADAGVQDIGKTIPWFTDFASRAQFPGIIIPSTARYITSQYDPTTLPGQYSTINEGDVWTSTSTNTNTYKYVYVSSETAAKHGLFAGREKLPSSTSSSSLVNVAATGDQGGLWVLAQNTWLRDLHSTYYFYNISHIGTVPYTEATAEMAVMPMISI